MDYVRSWLQSLYVFEKFIWLKSSSLLALPSLLNWKLLKDSNDNSILLSTELQYVLH